MTKVKVMINPTADTARQLTQIHHFDVVVRGTIPLLFNRPLMDPDGAKKRVTKEDPWEKEKRIWLEKLYATPEGIYQPSECVHEGLKKSAKYWGGTIPGGGKKTYTEVVKAGMICEPITFHKEDGSPILADDTKWIVPFDKFVKVGTMGRGGKIQQRRPMIVPGWVGHTRLTTFDGRLDREVVITLLTYMGQFNGLGDWRPTFGRFELMSCDEVSGERNE